MKSVYLAIICTALAVSACSTSPSSDQTAAPGKSPAPKKTSMYSGLSMAQVKKCMGNPERSFTANGQDYLSYFTPSRCEAIFIMDDKSQQVVDMKYLFPHEFTRFGYAVSEKQCPLPQKACLLA